MEAVDGRSIEMARLVGWAFALAFGLFTLFRVAEAWIRFGPHRASALFVTTSVILVVIGGALTTLALRALVRRRQG
jgi:uncharacterized membrane protein required for colicin V production